MIPDGLPSTVRSVAITTLMPHHLLPSHPRLCSLNLAVTMLLRGLPLALLSTMNGGWAVRASLMSRRPLPVP